MDTAASGYALAMASVSLQPLPKPWTEHIAPTGHYYYYNPITAESTYNRPFSLSLFNAPTPSSSQPTALPTKKDKKREKPTKKTPVPDSMWVRVLTNRGNVFYYDSEKKESTWDCPEEIEGIVEAMEAAELADAKDTMDAVTSEGPLGADMDMPGSPLGTKRKVREEEEGEYGADKPPAGKRKKREGEASEREKGKKTIGVEDAVEDEEDEEAWQRRLAEEMADEEGVNSAQENEKESAMEEMEAVPRVPLEEATQLFRIVLREAQINPMHPWETSLPLISSDQRYEQLKNSLQLHSQRDIFEEHCKAVLKERKAAKESSGGAEADTNAAKSAHEAYRELLKEMVTSTRMLYTEFRQKVKKERRFYSYGRDEKEREREFRSFLRELAEIKKNERKKAEEAFITMLKESKTLKVSAIPDVPRKWGDVKKEFQKDLRYDAVGSSTLREELYETFIKSLKDTGLVGVEGTPPSKDGEGGPEEGGVNGDRSAKRDAKEDRQRRREKAIREREERVRLEKERTARENARSKAGLNLEEAELAFNSLLIDTIRDPTVSFPSALSYLSTDPRFVTISKASVMTQARLHSLFQAHITRLQSKGSSVLHTLFENYAAGLDTRWEALPIESKNIIATNAAIKRLGLDAKVSLRPAPRSKPRRSGIGYHGERLERRPGSEEEDESDKEFEYPVLRQEFEKWQRQRFADARAAFDAMLSDNAFVGFWGRVGKMGITDQEEKQQLGRVVFADENAAGIAEVLDMDVDDTIEEGEGSGGKRDLQALAKGIDVKEVERVLRGDKRYIVFDYMPAERELWITDYLRNLSAPKASVHVG